MYMIAFGHAFEVERNASGQYQPAAGDRGGPLLGEFRLSAFRVMLEHAICDRLIVVGGYNDDLGCDKAEVIADMLPPSLHERVEWYRSAPHTLGNTAQVANILHERHLNEADCCCVTNFYHIPRLQQMFRLQGLHNVRILPAESILLWTEEISERVLVEAFRGIVPRLLNECTGITDLLADTYHT